MIQQQQQQQHPTPTVTDHDSSDCCHNSNEPQVMYALPAMGLRRDHYPEKPASPRPHGGVNCLVQAFCFTPQQLHRQLRRSSTASLADSDIDDNSSCSSCGDSTASASSVQSTKSATTRRSQKNSDKKRRSRRRRRARHGLLWGSSTPKKHVAFDEDENEVYYDTATREERQAQSYTRQDLAHFRKFTNQIAAALVERDQQEDKNNNDDKLSLSLGSISSYASVVTRVYHECCQRAEDPSYRREARTAARKQQQQQQQQQHGSTSTFKKKGRDNNSNGPPKSKSLDVSQQQQQQVDPEFRVWVQGASTRLGLELVTLPQLAQGTMRRRRRLYKTVATIQRKVPDKQLRQQFLSQAVATQSAPSRLFAQQWGAACAPCRRTTV